MFPDTRHLELKKCWAEETREMDGRGLRLPNIVFFALWYIRVCKYINDLFLNWSLIFQWIHLLNMSLSTICELR